MILVRLLLTLGLLTIGASLLMYLVTRDRRYLRFVVHVGKFTVLVLVMILVLFAAERLLAPVLGPIL